MKNQDIQEELTYDSKHRVYLDPLCSLLLKSSTTPSPLEQCDQALYQDTTHWAIENWSAFNSNI